ncbi:MAG: PrgI family protein [Candidatus Micrarchaeota archaeon]
MAYEIPSNLQYKEKIMFNLTFEQLLWIGVFGIISAIILIRAPFDLTVRFLIALPFMGIGTGFAFFGLFDRVKEIWVFHKSIKRAGYFDPKLEQLVGIKKIEKNVVYLKEGSIRAILQIMPLNFHMLSKTEQEAIIQAYKEFLNSLDFSVQIVMRTINLNLSDYLKKLELQALETKDPKILEQFGSFEEFVQNHIGEKKVKNRQFYVVIPYSPTSKTKALQDCIIGLQNLFSKQKKKTSYEINQQNSLQQLEIRVKLCQQKLKKSNLLSARLENDELLSLMAAFFDEFLETKNQYLGELTLIQNAKTKK